MVIKFDETKQKQQLEELRLKEGEDLAILLASRYGVDYVDLTKTSISPNALRVIEEQIAREGKIAAFKLFKKELSIAVWSPSQDYTQKIMNNLTDSGYKLKIHITSEESLKYAWERYKDLSYSNQSEGGTLSISEATLEEYLSKINSIETAKEVIDQMNSMKKVFRISKTVELIMAAAAALKASDVHIEPEEEMVVIRFRIDGVLIVITRMDFETYNLMLSRIKLLSGLKLNIKNEAQNGRFSIKIKDVDFEIRTSTLPGNNGESIVMRLLDPKSLTISLSSLGIPERLLELLKIEADKPNGLILTTGPTGSGKTTVLYSFLSRKNNPEIKIITIEDPIEYHLPGVVQTQIDRNRHYDFASGLKNSLRQDPDIIMVGEIRDNDTANTAVQAALTGHLVFSTLHTNNAAGAFPRLIGLGVDPKILTSAISVAIAQRLVRRVCEHCKKEVTLTGEKLESLKKIHEEIVAPDKPDFKYNIYESVGCEKCNGIGYKGRIGIFEAIFMNNEVEEAVQMVESENEIEKVARSQGIMNMKEDGLVKILSGITTIEEVERVVGKF